MRTFELVAAALIGYVSAIKMGVNQDNYTTETRAGNMGQTLTTESFTLDNLDAVQDEIEGWYGAVAKPYITSHREQVYKAALAEAEAEFGKLLETCDEGTKCREEVEKTMKQNILEIWQRVLTDFKSSVETSISETRSHVDVAWEKLVTCGEEANCCQYKDKTIINLWIQVSSYRTKIVEESSKWMVFEERRQEMWEECPNDITKACDYNVCYDGSERVACECAQPSNPPCPTSACSDGTARDVVTCGCPNDESEIGQGNY